MQHILFFWPKINFIINIYGKIKQRYFTATTKKILMCSALKEIILRKGSVKSTCNGIPELYKEIETMIFYLSCSA